MVAHDAVVLAGGTGRRMGGVLKPQVAVHGRRLLDHVLDATAGARRVVVVAPGTVPVPDGVIRTLEDPPHGGPVAGIAAGVRALGEPAPLVLLLACDLPGAAAAVPRLLATVRDGTGADGVVLRDAEGREQWLLGVYSSGALRSRIDVLATSGRLRGGSVRELVRPLDLRTVDARGGEARDVDTWEDRDAIAP
ncbi:molybdenum cofactor guanylyltransferase [Georgenia sp. H159]|uniref:molybdenum cofactor guanylyltransferase n=1 Tax=Georgenia sp. H159 TaxID=3076115 RepID=UPI002D775D99|nr:NTP transferase domain-containing protein [Georgenia sp. H159]